MQNTPLIAHELLCLHLRSFYDLQPSLPAPKAPKTNPSPK
jgi:hypothetical protein